MRSRSSLGNTELKSPKWYAIGMGVPSTNTAVSSGAEPRTISMPAPAGGRATPGMLSRERRASPLVPGILRISR